MIGFLTYISLDLGHFEIMQKIQYSFVHLLFTQLSPHVSQILSPCISDAWVCPCIDAT